MSKEIYRIPGCLLLLALYLVAPERTHCLSATPTLAKQELPADSFSVASHPYHFLINENFILKTDSIRLEKLPVKGQFHTLYKEDRVVVAEISTPASGDTLCIKLARDQEAQGWITAQEFFDSFVPTDLLSQFIYLLRNSYTPFFLIVFSLFTGWITIKFILRKKDIPFVYFNDIDSLYPLLFCLVTACTASLYESIQLFYPGVWQMFYMNPTFNPLEAPLIIAFFLAGNWLMLLLGLAVIEVGFRQLSPGNALFYLSGVASVAVFTYFFFIISIHFYIGYLFLLLLGCVVIKRALRDRKYRYQCGYCGRKIEEKSVCPHCGSLNQ